MNLQMNYQIENLPFVDYSCYFPKGRFNICSAQVPGYKMVNMLPSGKTPFLRLGYEKPRWRPPKNGEAQGNLYNNWLMASNLVDFFSPIRTKSSQLTQPPVGPVGLSFLANPRSHQLLHDLGFAIAAYPLTLLSAGLKAQEAALQSLKQKGQVEAGAPAMVKSCSLPHFGVQTDGSDAMMALVVDSRLEDFCWGSAWA